MLLYHGSYCKVKQPNISYSRDSLDFILDCRNGSSIYLDYDVIIGGIADDKVYNTIELYEFDLITKDEALKRLKYHKPNNQICITNQEILNRYLKFDNCEVISYGSK